jgi:WD40 repeat protein
MELMSQFEGVSPSRPLMALKFHPTIKDWLLTVDTDRNLVWWDWTRKVPIQTWRKAHSHIVNSIEFVPDTHSHRAVTCSTDHSIKFWRVDTPKCHVGSIHANAPFFSVHFSQDLIYATQPKGIIRIYKLKTLSLVKVVQIKELT